MTTPRLREELQHIADAAPVATVPADTWSRARSARRRNLAAGVVAAASVAVVAGLAIWLPGDEHASPPVVGTGSVGVPDRIEAVPSDVTQRETDLGVGQAAAAFLTDGGVPVVIGAADGRYHLLDLRDAAGTTLALSPDGELLAYTSTQGVRILDLTTGELRSDVDLTDSPFAETEIQQLEWAPTSDRLVFGGPRVGQGAAGRALVDADDWYPGGEINDDPEALWASTELGGFVGVGAERAWFHDGQTNWMRRVEAPGTPVAIHAVTPGVLDLRHDGERYHLYRHDASSDVALHLPVELSANLTVVGWLADSRMAVVDGNGHLLVVDSGDQAAIWDVGEVTAPIEQLTLATGLMTGDRLTVHRQSPDWDN